MRLNSVPRGRGPFGQSLQNSMLRKKDQNEDFEEWRESRIFYSARSAPWANNYIIQRFDRRKNNQ